MLRLFLNKHQPESIDGVVTELKLWLELMSLTSVLACQSSALNFAENILHANLVVVSCIATADLNSNSQLPLFSVRIVLICRFSQPLLLLVAKLREGRDEALSGCNLKDLHSCRPLAHPADSPLFGAEHLNRCDWTRQHNLSCACKQKTYI